MKYLSFCILFLLACSTANSAPQPPRSAKPTDDIRPAACQCTVDYETNGCGEWGDLDSDCVCSNEDNCPGTPNCDRANADSDGFGDLCDIMPNIADPEGAIAGLDTRIDAIEAADYTAEITSMASDVALLTAALVEIRSKYPDHYHGLLGINGDPVGSNGDLSYSLPGD